VTRLVLYQDCKHILVLDLTFSNNIIHTLPQKIPFKTGKEPRVKPDMICIHRLLLLRLKIDFMLSQNKD
jgi:hypothetical protein